MLLKKQVLDGVALSPEEINEMMEMIKEGKYYFYEVLEYYGISYYEFKCYKKVYEGRDKLYENIN